MMNRNNARRAARCPLVIVESTDDEDGSEVENLHVLAWQLTLGRLQLRAQAPVPVMLNFLRMKMVTDQTYIWHITGNQRQLGMRG